MSTVPWFSCLTWPLLANNRQQVVQSLKDLTFFKNALKASLSWVCCTIRKKLEAIIINFYEHK